MYKGYKVLQRGLFAFALVTCVSTSAFAAVPGCNPQVQQAQQAVAQAQVAQDTAIVEQIVDKPDSVLVMTCFNQAAGVSAADGGNVFTGDFSADLSPIISSALTAFNDQFEDGAGFDGAVLDYAATALSNTYNCTGMEDIWQAAEDEGATGGIPYATIADLISGALPAGAGDDFTKAWEAARDVQNVFNQVSTAVGALPTVSVVPPPPPANASSCEVLVTFGVIPGPC